MAEMTIQEMCERMKPLEKWFVEESSDAFSQETYLAYDDAQDLCESEIEKIFYVAWHLRLDLSKTLRNGRSNYTVFTPLQRSLSDFVFPDLDCESVRHYDLVAAQVQIDEYRADFLLQRKAYRFGTWITSPMVVIECDGHDFHERTKEQAARDKERDRIIQTKGMYVLRFTGSELWRDCRRCVDQVDEFLQEHLERKVDERIKSVKAEIRQSAGLPMNF